MGDKTAISWTDATWNPIRGCSRVSEGCRNCYAETMANRFKGPGQPYEGLIAKGGQWNGAIKLVPEKLFEPLRWTTPRMVFVNSMSDLFHENVPDCFIDKVFAVMAMAKSCDLTPITTPEAIMGSSAKMIHRCSCGGKACICEDGGKWAAHCMECSNSVGHQGFYDPCCESKEEAIRMWNVKNMPVTK